MALIFLVLGPHPKMLILQKDFGQKIQPKGEQKVLQGHWWPIKRNKKHVSREKFHIGLLYCFLWYIDLVQTHNSLLTMELGCYKPSINQYPPSHEKLQQIARFQQIIFHALIQMNVAWKWSPKWGFKPTTSWTWVFSLNHKITSFVWSSLLSVNRFE